MYGFHTSISLCSTPFFYLSGGAALPARDSVEVLTEQTPSTYYYVRAWHVAAMTAIHPYTTFDLHLGDFC